jgi:hypothetical protein
MAPADYYAPANHEAASKFLGQKCFRLNIQQPSRAGCNRLVAADRVRHEDPVQSGNVFLASVADEEIFTGPAADGVAGLGPDPIDAQGHAKKRDGARRR